MAQATYTGNPFTSYSPFFSSGLLAQHTAGSNKRRGTFNSDISEPWDSDDDDNSTAYASSPSRPSSPAAFRGVPDMDVEMGDFVTTPDARRSATPTPQTIHSSPETGTPMSVAKTTAQGSAKAVLQPAPRLRRRRSSLTQGTSPMVSIRSASRSVVNAMHLQKQLPSVSRSRSGSVGSEALGMLSIATETNRMRSGSCSSITSLPNPPTPGSMVAVTSSRPRRLPRRKGVQAPAAPPPSAPLPALPPTASPSSTQQKLRPSNINVQLASSLQTSSLKSPVVSTTSARGRGLSVSKSRLDGAENRIAE